MNLKPTERGLKILNEENGWFNSNYINFKYRLKNRKFIISWLYSVSRSMALIDGISKHDWLRRRAGILESVTGKYYIPILKNFIKVLFYKNKFLKIQTTDFTTNSRYLLEDMVATAVNNGLEIYTDTELLQINNSSDSVMAICKNETFQGKNMVVCLGSEIEKFSDFKLKKNFAPIAVVKNIKSNTESFVELDYFKKNCINIITKNKSYGLVGGISLKDEKETENYFNFMINQHKEQNPGIEVIKK